MEEEEPLEEEEIINETMFSFEALELVSLVFCLIMLQLNQPQKFAQSDITRTLLVYLERYKEFESSENMKRVVNLMHRQVVKAKAEGLYFQVSICQS